LGRPLQLDQRSKDIVRSPIILALSLVTLSFAAHADIAQEAEQHGDIEVKVELDRTAQSGRADATVRIHASREIVWSLIKSCTEAVVLVPGLIACEVLETAPDQSWQIIRHVLNYSWYLPKITYQIRATYEYPARISIERISGDLGRLKGSWVLQSDGDYTVARYSVELTPGFWIPRWIVGAVLRHDLPKMLRALRARAESMQQRE
jgi:hypothetical protein